MRVREGNTTCGMEQAAPRDRGNAIQSIFRDRSFRVRRGLTHALRNAILGLEGRTNVRCFLLAGFSSRSAQGRRLHRSVSDFPYFFRIYWE